MASGIVHPDGTYEVTNSGTAPLEAPPKPSLESVCGRAEASILDNLDLSPKTTGDKI